MVKDTVNLGPTEPSAVLKYFKIALFSIIIVVVSAQFQRALAAERLLEDNTVTDSQQIFTESYIAKTDAQGPKTPVAKLSLQLNGDSFHLDIMELLLHEKLEGKTVGWAYSISQTGQQVAEDGGGVALYSHDVVIEGNLEGFVGLDLEPSDVLMTPDTRINIASVTKNTTAIALLQLLEASSLTVDDLVEPWLPSDWFKGAGIESLTFRHLLTHTSGFNQIFVILAAFDAADPWNNSWDGLEFVVNAGAIPDSENSYKNANFALMRVLIPMLWKEFNPALMGIDITAENYGEIYLAYLYENLFHPAGIYNVSCEESNGYQFARAYHTIYTELSGAVFDVGLQDCGGHGNLKLSAVEINRYLVHALYNDAVLSPANRQLMDDFGLGWVYWSIDDSDDIFYHPGDLYSSFDVLMMAEMEYQLMEFSKEIHTCTMKMPYQLEAALIINSNVSSGKSACGILKEAFQGAVFQ